MYKRHSQTGNVRKLYIREHYVIREIRENFQVHGICCNCNMADVRNTFDGMQQLLFTYFEHFKNSPNKKYSRSNLKNG